MIYLLLHHSEILDRRLRVMVATPTLIGDLALCPLTQVQMLRLDRQGETWTMYSVSKYARFCFVFSCYCNVTTFHSAAKRATTLIIARIEMCRETVVASRGEDLVPPVIDDSLVDHLENFQNG